MVADLSDSFNCSNSQNSSDSSNYVDSATYKLLLDKFPICTVDVLLFNKNLDKTLLFKRNNPPLKDEYFSLGGRMLKNEEFLDCAVRQVYREIGLNINSKKLVAGGVVNELHNESIFPNVEYHCVNIYYGYIINDAELSSIKLDSQHDSYDWFNVTNSKLHPYMRVKINNLLKLWNTKRLNYEK